VSVLTHDYNTHARLSRSPCAPPHRQSAPTISSTAPLQTRHFNSCLTTLSLCNNDIIGVEGAKWIAEALKSNSCLTHLDLGGNYIGVKEAMWIAEAMLTNGSILVLDGVPNIYGGR
jgi:hypothetical protein